MIDIVWETGPAGASRRSRSSSRSSSPARPCSARRCTTPPTCARSASASATRCSSRAATTSSRTSRRSSRSAARAAEPPPKCPTCGAPLVDRGRVPRLPQRRVPRPRRGAHRELDRRAIGVLEWGDKLIEQLVEAKLVQRAGRPLQARSVSRHRRARAPRREDREEVPGEAQARLPLTLPVFLAALGIENFALQTAQAARRGGLRHDREGARGQRRASSPGIPGLGPIKAASIVRGLRARERRRSSACSPPGIVPVTPERGRRSPG